MNREIYSSRDIPMLFRMVELRWDTDEFEAPTTATIRTLSRVRADQGQPYTTQPLTFCCRETAKA